MQLQVWKVCFPFFVVMVVWVGFTSVVVLFFMVVSFPILRGCFLVVVVVVWEMLVLAQLMLVGT